MFFIELKWNFLNVFGNLIRHLKIRCLRNIHLSIKIQEFRII